jgi:hypothetical protein
VFPGSWYTFTKLDTVADFSISVVANFETLNYKSPSIWNDSCFEIFVWNWFLSPDKHKFVHCSYVCLVKGLLIPLFLFVNTSLWIILFSISVDLWAVGIQLIRFPPGRLWIVLEIPLSHPLSDARMHTRARAHTHRGLHVRFKYTNFAFVE